MHGNMNVKHKPNSFILPRWSETWNYSSEIDSTRRNIAL